MRFSLSNDARAKKIARALKPYFPALTYNHRLALSANLLGYRNWADLAASLGAHAPSPYDEALDPSEVADRRARHLRVLTDAGLTPDAAIRAIDEIRPTARSASASNDPTSRAHALIEAAARHFALGGLLAEHTTHRGLPALRVSPRGNPSALNPDHIIWLEQGAIAVIQTSDGGYTTNPQTIFHNRPFWNFLAHTKTAPLDQGLYDAILDLARGVDITTLATLAPTEHEFETFQFVAQLDPVMRQFFIDNPALAVFINDHVRIRILENMIARPGPTILERMLALGAVEGLADAISARYPMLSTAGLPALLAALQGFADPQDLPVTDWSLAQFLNLGETFWPRSQTEYATASLVLDRISDFQSDEALIPPYILTGFSRSWHDFMAAISSPRRPDLLAPGLSRAQNMIGELCADVFAETYGLARDYVEDTGLSAVISRRIRNDIYPDGLIASRDRANDALERHRADEPWSTHFATTTSLLSPHLHAADPITFLKCLGYSPDIIAGLIAADPDIEFDNDGHPMLPARLVGVDPAVYARKPGASPAPKTYPALAPVLAPSDRPPARTTTPPGWTRQGDIFINDTFRIRWSKGRNEPNATPGWRLDQSRAWISVDNMPPARVYSLNLGVYDEIEDAIAASLSATIR